MCTCTRENLTRIIRCNPIFFQDFPITTEPPLAVNLLQILLFVIRSQTILTSYFHFWKVKCIQIVFVVPFALRLSFLSNTFAKPWKLILILGQKTSYDWGKHSSKFLFSCSQFDSWSLLRLRFLLAIYIIRMWLKQGRVFLLHQVRDGDSQWGRRLSRTRNVNGGPIVFVKDVGVGTLFQ